MATLLLTNDDGIFARGIRTLAKHLLTAGHTVMVVAPDRERSATSHALTLHEPLRVNTHDDLLDQGCLSAYSVSGTPVDCVKMAFHSLMPQPPDLVISGINHGPNLGNDIIYSGTVSAALEGAMQGAKSLAVSHASGYLPTARFDTAARFVVDFLPQLSRITLPEQCILNANVPDPYEGVQVTRLSTRLYHNFYDLREDPRHQAYYWLDGTIVDINDGEDSDTYAVKHHKASVTPVKLSLLEESMFHNLQTLLPI